MGYSLNIAQLYSRLKPCPVPFAHSEMALELCCLLVVESYVADDGYFVASCPNRAKIGSLRQFQFGKMVQKGRLSPLLLLCCAPDLNWPPCSWDFFSQQGTPAACLIQSPHVHDMNFVKCESALD